MSALPEKTESSILAKSHVMVAADPVEEGKLAAGMTVAHARSALLRKERFDLVISGGSSPIPFFRSLAQEHGGSIDWTRVRFFWADERDVPPTHPDSNYRLAHELLLGPLGIRPENVFRIPTGRIPAGRSAEEAAAAYEMTLRNLFGERPCFDQVMLGLGQDGHTASLFPDAREQWMKAQREGRWVSAIRVPHLNSRRITLLPHQLSQAMKVCFLVSGENKAGILRKVLSLDGKTKDGKPYPAQLIHPRSGKPFWLADSAAASRLHAAHAA